MPFLRQVIFQKSKNFGIVPEGENGKKPQITVIGEVQRTAYNVKTLEAWKGNSGRVCRQ